MYELPKEPIQIRQRIRRYERKFKNEKESWGMIGDGAGTRFLLAPLYLLMDDLEGAIASFEWYEKEFPDDSPDAAHHLCWSLALHRADQERKAIRKLGQTMIANLYLIPCLLGNPIPRLDIWHGSNLEWPEYVALVPEEFLDLWQPQDSDWARHHYESPPFQRIKNRYIEIQRELKDESPGPRRSELVNESSALARFEI